MSDPKRLLVKVVRIERHTPTVFTVGTSAAELVTFGPISLSVDGTVEAIYPAGTWHIGDETTVEIGSPR